MRLTEGDLQEDYLHSIKFLERWTPGSQPLYHRHKDLHWHDMCAEALGMPKVALLFLTRGPIHMVRAQKTTYLLMLCIILCSRCGSNTMTVGARYVCILRHCLIGSQLAYPPGFSMKVKA